MSLVKLTNKKTGITYVYESESYWDKEKKQPRNKRKLIGKIDPQTGEIVPTRGHRPVDDKTDVVELKAICKSYEKKISRQEETIQSQKEEILKLKSERKSFVRQLKDLISEMG